MLRGVAQSSSTEAKDITVGTTTVTGGADGGILYDNAGILGEKTVTGSGLVVEQTTPTLITPVLGVATATSVNKVAFTAPATSATLTIPDGVTLTGPATSGTAMTLGNAETVTGVKTFGAAGNVGKLLVAGTTSGTTTLNATAVASGTLTLPAATDTLVGKATTDTLTNKTLTGNTAANLVSGSGTLTLNTTGTATVPNATDTLVGKATTDTLTNKTYDTAGTGNSFSINGVAATANTGTGAVARAAAPTFTTPTIGAALATSINFGGTSLSTYAEGTWTPALAFGGVSTGIVYSTQGGTYVKVGKAVTVQGIIIITNNGSGTGTASLSGLPFTSDTVRYGIVSIGFYSGCVAVVGTLTAYIAPNGTTITIQNGSATGSVNATETNLSDSTTLIFSATYISAT